MCTIPNHDEQVKSLHILSAVRTKIPSSKAYSNLQYKKRNYLDDVALVDISAFEPKAKAFNYDEAHKITSDPTSVDKYIIVGVTSSSDVYLIWDGKTHEYEEEKKPSAEFISSLKSLSSDY